MYKRPSILIGMLLIGSTALADGDQPVTQTAPTVKNEFFCPAINALVKDPDTMTWSTAKGWKSFDMSFVDKITRFSGAQWRGTNVGQIFCVYRGESETSFPILLAYSTLTYEPQGGKWSANLGGYQNCESPNQQDCPFSIRVKSEDIDLYQQAAKLKQPTSKSTTPGF